MPPQPPTTFRIEDLKARLKLEPKSRLFYPLAEELRKLDRHADAEKILRDGLAIHGGYISAWMSLGRVLAEQQKHADAVTALQKAAALDPGNIVAARLLGDAYVALGEKVEAIKKYKLVRALLPADEEVQEKIALIEAELKAGGAGAVPAAPVAEAAPPAQPMPVASPEPAPQAEPAVLPSSAPAAEPVGPSEAMVDTTPFEATEPPVPLTPTFSAGGAGAVQAVDVDAAMSGAGFTSAASEYAEEVVPPRKEVVGEAAVAAEDQREFPLPEQPTPIRTVEEPFGASMEPPPSPSTIAESIFDETHPFPRHAPLFEDEPPQSDTFATETMADVYARQGLTDAAREIYSKVLEREPQNKEVRSKLDALSGAAQDQGQRARPKPAVTRLESWLSKVRK